MAADTLHPVIASGVVHHDLLEVHPFESANGRLARAAARLVLRRGGLDPGGLAAPEPILAADALGYHEEVVATVRRGDLVQWLERWAEAVAAGLRMSAARLTLEAPAPPARAAAVLARLDATDFTVADYREAVDVDLDAAQADLRTLVDARLVTRVPGSRGLRYRTTGVSAGERPD